MKTTTLQKTRYHGPQVNDFPGHQNRASVDDVPTMENPRTRPLTPKDLPALSDLCNRSLPLDPFTADVLERKLLADRDVDPALNRVAEIDDRLVGVIAGQIHPAAPPPDDPRLAGFLKLWAVDPDHQNRSIGTTLLAEWETAARQRNAERVVTLAAPGYLWPGVDVRYTKAACILEARGYIADRWIVNMNVDLTPDADTDFKHRESQLRDTGCAIRRLSADTLEPTLEFIRAHFSEIWLHELAETLRNDPVSAFIATRDGRVAGFAAYDVVMFRGCFGPMGTDPAERGRGIGQVLLEKCLQDMRAKGYARCEIVWIGPMAFYSKTVNATVCRQFRNYTKDLS